LVAALFAAHPLHVESVAWISERKDVLSAFFGLLALLAYAKYVTESKVQSPKSKVWYGGALICFALGLMSKPMLVTWPFVMFLMDYWPLRRIQHSTFNIQHSTHNQLGNLIFEKLPFLALVVGSCVITMMAQRRGGAVQALADTSITARVANAAVSYVRYLGKAIWPVDLAVPYPLPNQWPLATILGSAVLLAAITAGAFLIRRRHPAVWMGWLWFGGTLVPVIGLVQVGGQAMADRYFYLPSIGLFVAVGFAQLKIQNEKSEGKGTSNHVERGKHPTFNIQRPSGMLAIGAAVVVVGLLSWRTVAQIKVWRDTETLFTNAIRVTRGNYLAHYNLGHFYDLAGRKEEAREQYELALRIKPRYADANNNLGAFLAGRREYAKAIEHFRAALASRPGDASFRKNLSRAQVLGAKELMAKGNADNALAWLTEAVQQTPESYEAQNGLGTLLAMTGRVAEAVPHYEAALRIKPDSAAIHANLGKALSAVGRTNEAAAHLQEAARLMQAMQAR
jgi:Tfp pilus assembly protein PilF